MNTITYLFGEPKFPEVSPGCKLTGEFVDLPTVGHIRRFLKIYRNQVTPPGGYYCDGRKLLSGSIIGALMPSEYMRAFQELLRAMATAPFPFRIVVPKRMDDFINPDPAIKSMGFRDGQTQVVARPMSVFAHEINKFDAWELSIIASYEVVFPDFVYEVQSHEIDETFEQTYLAQVYKLASSPLILSNVLGINSLRIEPVRNAGNSQLFIHYSFIDIYNHIWKIIMPGKMRRREQIRDVIDNISFAGMTYDDMPAGMADASLPWGLIHVN